ncbi:MAG TPA: hypothetical protein VMT01_00440 [Candidatus Acidoferrum sp.]|nr:hypothetical protein [Candidatus Acidoferrum sp.]
MSMYSELYETWRREFQSAELTKLPDDFYPKLAEYLKKLKEESRMIDKRTVKARLLKIESENAKRMLKELTGERYRKILRKAVREEKTPSEFLTLEETKLMGDVLPFAEAHQAFISNLLRGQLSQLSIEKHDEHVAVRLSADIPPIVGVDMKPYGPFEVEDIASLPLENAKALIKQGVAVRVETS